MILFAESGSGSLTAVLALIVASALLFWRAHRRIGPRQRGTQLPSFKPRQHHEEAPRNHGTLDFDAPDSLARWEVQMHETARELSARIDNKLQALNHLIDLADTASARLESLVDRATTPSATATPGETTSHHPTLGRGLQPPDKPDPSDATSHLSTKPSETIYALADSGQSPPDIAGQVNLPLQEVQLILSLRQPS